MKLADYTPEIPRYHSQVLDRVVAILACYSEGRSEFTFTEFLQETALSKSTLYRLLQVLEQHRFLERKDGGIYSLGLKIFELGSIAFASMNLQRLTTPHLEKLVDVTGETAHLGVLDGSEVVFIAKAESPHPVRIPSGVGFRSPAYCTGVGKALLCGLSEADLNTYLSRSPLERLTDRTIVSPEHFKEELRVTRDRGYSLNLGELTEDIRCVGAPIYDHSRRVVAAVSVAAPAHRFKRQNILRVANLVKETAAEISRQLGFEGNAKLSGKKTNRTKSRIARPNVQTLSRPSSTT